MEILFLLIGLLVGAFALWLWGRELLKRLADEKQQSKDLATKLQSAERQVRELNQTLEDVRSQVVIAEKDLGVANERIRSFSENDRNMRAELEQLREEYAKKLILLTHAQTRSKSLEQDLEKQASQHSQILSEVQQRHQQQMEQLRKEFEALRENSRLEFGKLAHEILEDKAKRFGEQNREALGHLLYPYREKLEEFRKKVEEVHATDLQGRATLLEQVRQLQEQTGRVTQEASNLTNALKGQIKSQGNWGEEMLERLLDLSGLRINLNYRRQETIRIDGELFRPDILIDLPGERCIVIDSKVSLLNYERYVNSNNAAEQKIELENHVASIRKHIKDLSNKRYDEIRNPQSLDFVILFMPIEPAYIAALEKDRDLWIYAYEKRVILSSPTNLIAMLKMIGNLWDNQKIKENMRTIAEEGGKLYDKFVSFIDDMQGIEKALRKAQNEYDGAFAKLKGHGGLVGKAKRLRELGVKAKKSLDQFVLHEQETGEEEDNSLEALNHLDLPETAPSPPGVLPTEGLFEEG